LLRIAGNSRRWRRGDKIVHTDNFYDCGLFQIFHQDTLQANSLEWVPVGFMARYSPQSIDRRGDDIKFSLIKNFYRAGLRAGTDFLGRQRTGRRGNSY